VATELDLVNRSDPDAELFLVRFPVFAPVDSGLVQIALSEATTHVDSTWLARDYQMAIMYFAAHSLWMEGEPQRSLDAAALADDVARVQTVAGGQVKRTRVGDVETEFHERKGNTLATSGSDAANKVMVGAEDELSRSTYGRKFIALRRRSRGHMRAL